MPNLNMLELARFFQAFTAVKNRTFEIRFESREKDTVEVWHEVAKSDIDDAISAMGEGRTVEIRIRRVEKTTAA